MGSKYGVEGEGKRMKLKAIPLELKEANEFVNSLHRHHKAVYRDKFRIGAMIDGKVVGVVLILKITIEREFNRWQTKNTIG